MDRRLSRRKPTARLALSVGAFLLLVAGLSGCGFNYATDRSNTIAAGVSDQNGEVDVLNAMVVSAQDGSGTLIATLSNNSPKDTYHLQSVSFGSSSTVSVASFDPIEVKPSASVNLADGQGIKVSGSSIKAGYFVSVTLTFDGGETADMSIPVMAAANEFADLDNGTGSPSPVPSPSAS
jgi:hypothetical protein